MRVCVGVFPEVWCPKESVVGRPAQGFTLYFLSWSEIADLFRGLMVLVYGCGRVVECYLQEIGLIALHIGRTWSIEMEGCIIAYLLLTSNVLVGGVCFLGATLMLTQVIQCLVFFCLLERAGGWISRDAVDVT